METEEELASLPMWQQGNPEMHTPEKLTERMLLRNHPAVVEQLQEWWLTAQQRTV